MLTQWLSCAEIAVQWHDLSCSLAENKEAGQMQFKRHLQVIRDSIPPS